MKASRLVWPVFSNKSPPKEVRLSAIAPGTKTPDVTAKVSKPVWKPSRFVWPATGTELVRSME